MMTLPPVRSFVILYRACICPCRTADSVEGSPECGCIEEMPVVSEAACTRHHVSGLVPCGSNRLYNDYNGRLDQPKGPMDFNLVKRCDNEDVPDYDYRSCEHNTYMCCWTARTTETA